MNVKWINTVAVIIICRIDMADGRRGWFTLWAFENLERRFCALKNNKIWLWPKEAIPKNQVTLTDNGITSGHL